MGTKMTLSQREKELAALLATPMGRQQIQELASRYSAASGELPPAGKSLITFILVHERAQGLIHS
jgi:hypothetical protein